jgi:CheY-like chemotaxis protein
MSHEIRTPLNGIIGITDALAHSTLCEQDMEYVEMISNSGNNLLHIIDEILDLSRDRASCEVHEAHPESVLRKDFSILVVEDDIVNQKVIQLLLDKLQLQAEYVKNGLEAINALKLKSYEIVFMDMEMPKMGGVEATKFIRGHNLGKHPFIIALTANAFEDNRIECLDAGMDGFLAKPVNIDAIKNQLLKFQDTAA